MQQWEYRTVTLHPITGFSRIKGWKLKEIGEQKLPNWQKTEKYTSVESFCNQMGLQGWELVSAGDITYTGFLLCFKRPYMKENL
jgi:hypothetical protein